jgi:hypothetical protein
MFAHGLLAAAGELLHNIDLVILLQAVEIASKSGGGSLKIFVLICGSVAGGLNFSRGRDKLSI